MKKFLSVNMILVLLTLCSCSVGTENISETRFLLDTAVNLDVACDEDTLAGAFELCEYYEKIFSRTLDSSDVSRLNSSDGFIEVSNDTARVIEKAIYYSDLSGGAYDITICPVSLLWDFEGTALPDRNEIAEALKNVDYQAIETDGNKINLNGKKIDLGSIAKGYIADRLLSYFKANETKEGIINLGGNVVVFGNKDYTVGIAKPFSETENIANIKLRNKSAVTSGIYQRYIKSDEKIYHHILDKNTGYAVENKLASVTVIGDSSVDCDALSTVCMLLGKNIGKALVSSLDGYEAIFIEKDENISYTSGLYRESDTFYLKQ